MGAEATARHPPPPPPQHHHHHHFYYNPNPNDSSADYILLPPYRQPSSFFRTCRRISCFILPILLLSSSIFLLWPSDPELKIVRVQLDNIRVNPYKPLPSIDISLHLTVHVRNRDFFSLRYRSLLVSIAYRGRQLGFVTSDAGRIKARASSYVDADLVLDGIEVLHDVFYLLEDLARGCIPFNTVTDFNGQIRVLFLDVPLQATVSCEVYVNTKNQTVIRQDCYPE
ncbi:transmembrane protein 106B [Cinnamomum micranthum f. kanehirae]|uniref:Transmembrane protein 106B n=1 Tax=Cinnamomum micranthum f. kanehirae TaxID=337451 RepID=A0A3S3M5R7_9MAGN|nr:transmembrane protein 106B [Cinnamomum micranthum f. kanehirae]